MHSTNIVEDNYLGSGKLLKRSINKYGLNNHSREILEFSEDREQLALREREIVNEILIKEDKCLNLKVGGEGGFCKEMNIDFKSRNRKCTTKLIEKLQSCPILQKKFKDNVKVNINSESSQTKARQTKLSKYNKIGWINSWPDGTKHTDEAKQKISESMKGKMVGSKNPNFGNKNKCVSKDGITKRIPIDQVENYLADGWILGIKKK
jgi:hypothetical protein